MKRIVYTSASLMIAVIMMATPLSAQVRGGGTTRQSGGTSTQSGGTSRQSGSTSTTSGSTSRQSGSSSSGSGSTVRQGSSSSSSSGSTYHIGGTSRQSGSTSTGSGSTVRQGSSGSSNTGSASRSGASTTSGSTVRQGSSSGSTVRQGGSATTSSASSGSSTGSVGTRAGNVTRSGLSSGSGSASSSGNSGTYRDEGGNYRYDDDMRMDDNRNLSRISPRDRDFLPLDRPRDYWSRDPHYYGYRVRVLPTGYRRVSHWGIDYYYHNGIYYRSYGNVWVVSRPPYGTPLERAIDAAIFRAVNFAYYNSTYRTYNTVFDNYNVIAQQNLIIAQNNARIISQNGYLALNNSRALSAYELANRLGLVQSYAYANSQYFYQDGVFFIVTSSGQFTTIVPPAGALVTSLPDDYDIIVMNGVEYYLVDNTVYRTTLFDGQPFLEVLGQMYGSMYNQYSPYYYR